MRILRCERCKKPCTLTTLSDTTLMCCPANGEGAEWRQVNTSKPRHTGKP